MEGGLARVRAHVVFYVHMCVFFSFRLDASQLKRGDNKNKAIAFDSGSISERQAGGGSSCCISFLSQGLTESRPVI